MAKNKYKYSLKEIIKLLVDSRLVHLGGLFYSYNWRWSNLKTKYIGKYVQTLEYTNFLETRIYRERIMYDGNSKTKPWNTEVYYIAEKEEVYNKFELALQHAMLIIDQEKYKHILGVKQTLSKPH